MNVSKANFLVSEANILVSKERELSAGARIFRGPNLLTCPNNYLNKGENLSKDLKNCWRYRVKKTHKKLSIFPTKLLLIY